MSTWSQSDCSQELDDYARSYNNPSTIDEDETFPVPFLTYGRYKMPIDIDYSLLSPVLNITTDDEQGMPEWTSSDESSGPTALYTDSDEFSDSEDESEITQSCRQALADARTKLELLRSELSDAANSDTTGWCTHTQNPRKRCFSCALPPLISLQNPDLHTSATLLGPRRKRRRLLYTTTTSRLSAPSNTSGRSISLAGQGIRAMAGKKLLQSQARALGLDGLPPNRWVGRALVDDAVPWPLVAEAKRRVGLVRHSVSREVIIREASKAEMLRMLERAPSVAGRAGGMMWSGRGD